VSQVFVPVALDTADSSSWNSLPYINKGRSELIPSGIFQEFDGIQNLAASYSKYTVHRETLDACIACMAHAS